MPVPLIGEASESDADQVVALWHACGLTRPWNDPAADFTLALRTQTAAVLVARDAAQVVASVMVGFDGHRGWIYYLAVDPSHRGAGVGRALMAAAEAWLKVRGCPKVQLMVREDNEAALGFYQALGMEPQPVVTLGRFLND